MGIGASRHFLLFSYGTAREKYCRRRSHRVLGSADIHGSSGGHRGKTAARSLPRARIMTGGDFLLSLLVLDQFGIDVTDEEAQGDVESNISLLSLVEREAKLSLYLSRGLNRVISRWAIHIEEASRRGGAHGFAIEFDGGLNRRPHDRLSIKINAATVRGQGRQ